MSIMKATTIAIALALFVCAAAWPRWVRASADPAVADGGKSETVAQHRERFRLLRLQAQSEYAGYLGEGYLDAIPALTAMLHEESDPEIARDIVQTLGEIAALDALGDLHRSVTDPVLAAEIEIQLSRVLANPMPVVRQRRVSGALAAYAFLGGHQAVLQRAALILLAAPPLVLALWCFVHLPLSAALARFGLIVGASIAAVLLGGFAGLLGGDMPRADPGTALIIFVPFAKAVVLLPVVVCACVIRLNAGGDRLSTVSNAAIWAAAYVLLQLGTWAFIPLILRDHYFYYGSHPSWLPTHVAHSIAAAAICALIGWRLTAANQRMRVSGPLDRLASGTYVAVMFPCLIALGLGYLIANVYTF